MLRIATLALVLATAVTATTMSTNVNARDLNKIDQDARNINRDANELRGDSIRGARNRGQLQNDNDALVGAAMRGDARAVLRDVQKVREGQERVKRDNREIFGDRIRLERDKRQLKKDVLN